MLLKKTVPFLCAAVTIFGQFVQPGNRYEEGGTFVIRVESFPALARPE
jgi:hypothetical protein